MVVSSLPSGNYRAFAASFKALAPGVVPHGVFHGPHPKQSSKATAGSPSVQPPCHFPGAYRTAFFYAISAYLKSRSFARGCFLPELLSGFFMDPPDLLSALPARNCTGCG